MKLKRNLPFRIISSIFLFVLLFSNCESKITERKNEIRVRLAAEPDRLSLILTGSGYAEQVLNYLFLSLQQYDPEGLDLKPVLIKQGPEIIEITEGDYKGGLAYTFELLDEAKWDNGAAVLASDFLFTMKVIWNPHVQSPARNDYGFLSDVIIDKNNPRKFTVYTNGIYFNAEAALSYIPIYPAYNYDPDSLLRDFSLKEIMEDQKSEDERLKRFANQFNSARFSHDPDVIKGCGQYAVVSWDKGQQIVLEKKENWWGANLSEKNDLLKANPSKIIYKIIPDNTAAVTAMKDGQLDVVSEIEPSTFVELRNNDFVKGNFELHTPPYLSYAYLGLNTAQAKLATKEVRRALAHLVDMDQAIESFIFDLGERTVGPIHPAKFGYHKALKLIPYDLETARRLLAEAGWGDTDENGILDKTIEGQQVELRLSAKYTVTNEVAGNIITLLKESAAKVGIVIEPEGLEFKTLIQDYRGRDFDLLYASWSQMPGQEDLRQIWHTSSNTPRGFNRTGFGDAASDTIIDALGTTLDEEKRNQLYLSIQERIYEDQNYIFLYAPLRRIAISRNFKGKTSARRPGFFVNQFERKN